jgi:signal transduction histidine kinase
VTVASESESGFEIDPASAVTLLYGVTLLGLAGYHHLLREAAAIDQLVGPLLALFLDGGLAVCVAGIGVWLARSSFSQSDRGTVTLFGVGGSLTFTLAVAATVLVRAVEGRTVGEWEFTLLTTLGAGFLAGAVGGFYRVDARRETRTVRRTRDAVAFVNAMLRHDVRNDANVIAGYAEAVEGDPETRAVLRERAEAVVERTNQARAVAAAVSADAELEALDPVPVVEAAVAAADETFRRATFEVAADGQFTIRANEALRPVLDNLLENAVEHHDEPDPTVRVTVDREGAVVRIRVIDDGPGVPADERVDLFDYDDPGTAAGLNVVGTIVDGLDGRIWVEDREDQSFDSDDAAPGGSVFVVELPAVDSVTLDGGAGETGAGVEPFV